MTIKQFVLRRFIVHIFLILNAIAFFTTCSKQSDVKPQAQPACIITSISPDNGPSGTTVTISGTGFSSNITDNAVSFNGVDATITAATTTQLTVTAPNATSGSLKVSVKGTPTIGPNFSFYDLYAFGYLVALAPIGKTV